MQTVRREQRWGKRRGGGKKRNPQTSEGRRDCEKKKPIVRPSWNAFREKKISRVLIQKVTKEEKRKDPEESRQQARA